jgi:hypothetical protein
MIIVDSRFPICKEVLIDTITESYIRGKTGTP